MTAELPQYPDGRVQLKLDASVECIDKGEAHRYLAACCKKLQKTARELGYV